eukprot:3433853-Rhodomonas_salina.2
MNPPPPPLLFLLVLVLRSLCSASCAASGLRAALIKAACRTTREAHSAEHHTLRQYRTMRSEDVSSYRGAPYTTSVPDNA